MESRGVEVFNCKPVKFLEICGTLKNKPSDIFNDQGVAGEAFVNNGYGGVPCDCQKNEDYSKCNHSTMFGDSAISEYVVGLLLKGHTGDFGRVRQQVSAYSDEDLEKMVFECDRIRDENE